MKSAATPVPSSLKNVILIMDARTVTFQPPMREKRYSFGNCEDANSNPASRKSSSFTTPGLIAAPSVRRGISNLFHSKGMLNQSCPEQSDNMTYLAQPDHGSSYRPTTRRDTVRAPV